MTTRLQKDSNSHRILAFLFAQTNGEARSRDIVQVDSWAFGARNNDGPMGTLMSNHYVIRVSRGLYQITVGGMKALDELNKP